MNIDMRTEAARYALLRRLAPSMRHHLVVHLQPIGMVHEVMDRRLRAAQPDLEAVKENAQKIRNFTRAALDSCNDVMTWLAPPEGRAVAVNEAVHECMHLLVTSLAFRGFALTDDVAAIDAQVSRASIRTVLTGALVCMADQNPAPAAMNLGAALDGAHVVFTLEVQPSHEQRPFYPEIPYRALDWDDLEALANAESVGLDRSGNTQIKLTFAVAAH